MIGSSEKISVAWVICELENLRVAERHSISPLK